MAGVGLVRHGLDLALHHELVVVQVTVVRGHPEVVAHVLAAQALLPGHEGLEELLPVAGADDLCAGVPEELLHRLGQVADGGGVRFLDEQVAGIGVLKGELHKVHGLVQVHEEPGHAGVSDGDGLAGLNLVDKQGNHRAAAAHDVAVPGAADDGAAPFGGYAGVGVDDPLHHGLGDAHGVDGVGGLVRGQAHHTLDAGLDSGMEDVVRTDNVCAHGLHGEELAGGHLFEGCGMEDVVYAGHGVPHSLRVAHVAYVELDLLGSLRVLGLELMAHIVLLLLVPGEDANLADVGFQEVF